MKKAETKYYFTDDKLLEHIDIKVSEDTRTNSNLDYTPIWVEYSQCWRNPKDAIYFYKWVIKCIEEIETKQTKERIKQ